jgi:hypothetical protein
VEVYALVAMPQRVGRTRGRTLKLSFWKVRLNEGWEPQKVRLGVEPS